MRWPLRAALRRTPPVVADLRRRRPAGLPRPTGQDPKTRHLRYTCRICYICGISRTCTPLDHPMTHVDLSDITKREREILDILFARGRASAAEVLADLREPPSYSAVRTLLHRLEQKGFVAHEEEKRTYIYAPVVDKDEARENALTHLLKTFFNNSTESAVAALLTRRGKRPSAQELERVKRLVEDARKRGR